VIAPQQDFTGLDGALEIAYDGIPNLVFPNCRLLHHTFDYTPEGLIWRLSIADRRWKWKYGSITGSYNLDWPDGSLNKLTELDAKGLASLCFDAMGESQYDVSALPGKVRPEVHWDHTNPAQALADLGDNLGCRVVLGLDNIPRVLPTGIGA